MNWVPRLRLKYYLAVRPQSRHVEFRLSDVCCILLSTKHRFIASKSFELVIVHVFKQKIRFLQCLSYIDPSAHIDFSLACFTCIQIIALDRNCRDSTTSTKRMSSDKTPRRSNQEWEQLKALRSYRDRLVNKATYSKLDKSQVLADEIGLENHIDLLENGLRNIMRRHDLDVYFTNGLDREAMDSAKASLKSLCALLERIVNTELLDLGHSEDVEHANLIKYPRLNGLLTRLSDTTWNFTMVSKARWKLFQSDSPEVDKNQVDNINTLFNRLAQLEIGSLQPSEAKTAASNFEICGPRDQFTNALKTLEVLLSRLEKLKNCQGCHKVLLQLPKWDTAASHECFRDTHLELFVSTCHDPQEWQESQLSFLSQRSVDMYTVRRHNLWKCPTSNKSKQRSEFMVHC